MIRKTLPEIVDMHFPPEGIFHNIVFVSIDKRYPGHARKVMSAFWGLGQLMFSKTIVVVDKDVDVQNVSEVAWIAGTHVDPQRDIQFTIGPMDDLENASNLPAYGSKMGIDATRKWPSEGFTREWPTRLKTTDAAARKADELLKLLTEGEMTWLRHSTRSLPESKLGMPCPTGISSSLVRAATSSCSACSPRSCGGDCTGLKSPTSELPTSR